MTKLTHYLSTLHQMLVFRDKHLSPNEQYRATLLQIAIYGNLFVTMILAIYAIVEPSPHQLLGLSMVAIMLSVNVWALIRLHQGAIQLVSRLIIAISWISLAIGAFQSGGVYSPAIMGLVVLFVTANLLLDMKARIVMLMATLVYIFVLLALELSGNLPVVPFKDLPLRMIVLSSSLTTIFLVVNYHLYALRQSENQNITLQVDAERFRVQRELTQDLAHDLRTPLTTLLASVYLISQFKDRGLPIDKALIRLEDQGRRLDALIEDLFQMTLLDMDDKKKTLNVISIATIAINSVADAKQYADTRNIQIFLVNEADDSKRVIGHRNQIKRVFDNLIENAIHYGRENGHINIHIMSDDSQYIIHVQDDGIGIAAEKHEKIFERFYRVDSARSSEAQQGSGVGLNAVQRIVQLHGGSILLDSDLGKGSTFKIHIPYLKPAKGFVASQSALPPENTAVIGSSFLKESMG